MYSGRKRNITGLVYLQGLPYRDAEGSSHLRSYLHDAIINTSPRIGGKLKKTNCIENWKNPIV